MKIFVAQLDPIVGDIKGNVKKIIEEIEKAKSQKADVIVFSEMVVTGYPPEDLVHYEDFIDKAEKAVNEILPYTKDLMVIVGTIRRNLQGVGNPIYNTAAVLCDQNLLGYKDKTLLPTYDVFDERRYFCEGADQKVFSYKGSKIGILICEDIWGHGGQVRYTKYKRDPVEELKKLQPDIVVNLSASPYYFQKKDTRIQTCLKAYETLKTPLILCNQVGANDQLVFDGYSFVLNDKGQLVYMAKGFEEDSFLFDTEIKYQEKTFAVDPEKDLFEALVIGVKDYFIKQGLKSAHIALSGGIDSALVLCIAVKALGKENVYPIFMPSRFTSLESIEDAHFIASNLNVSLKEIPIDEMFQNYLNLLSPYFYGKGPDVTEENLQARIRGVILMAFSNKFGSVVLSTGNKSEMAMGYATLYGDMCGGLDVLIDVSKTRVYSLARWLNRDKEIIPQRIIEKAPSAELKEGQTDYESLPSYEIVDSFRKIC